MRRLLLLNLLFLIELMFDNCDISELVVLGSEGVLFFVIVIFLLVLIVLIVFPVLIVVILKVSYYFAYMAITPVV